MRRLRFFRVPWQWHNAKACRGNKTTDILTATSMRSQIGGDLGPWGCAPRESALRMGFGAAPVWKRGAPKWRRIEIEQPLLRWRYYGDRDRLNITQHYGLVLQGRPIAERPAAAQVQFGCARSS